MATLILIILLITLIISRSISKHSWNSVADTVYISSVISLFVWLTVFMIILSGVSNGLTIDSKIELYQSQNAEIESKVQATVASYLAHEKQTYKDLKPDNAIAVVSAYPELHSNELVKKQIEVYEDNNKKILGLKEAKLNQPIYKWWLYFGR